MWLYSSLFAPCNTHFSLWLHFLYATLLGRNPRALASPTFWGIQCNPGVTCTASCSAGRCLASVEEASPSALDILHDTKATITWITLPSSPARFERCFSTLNCFPGPENLLDFFSFESSALTKWGLDPRAPIPLFQCKSDLFLIAVLSLTIIASFQHRP